MEQGLQRATLVARLNAQAEISGTYTVLVSDSSPSGTGSYQLQLAKVPGSFTVTSQIAVTLVRMF